MALEFSTVLVVLLFLSPLISGQETEKGRCASCPMTYPGMLNVHLVPHSHDDVGWLKTVDQYYLGSARAEWGRLYWQLSQRAGVGDMLDSVLRSLALNSDRKFIQVETAYFWRWWNEQDELNRERFRNLVEAGQIEFIGGGWSMNDEAATHYVGIIDNMALGFRILNETFGECGRPRVAWQIDPFGHSREQAFLFSQMDLEGFFIGRLDFRDKERRKENKEMEMIWHTSDDLISSDIYAMINYNNYDPPSGFCFDYYCFDDPMIDSETQENNIDQRVNEFLAHVQEQAISFQSNHILMCMGTDFHYQAAHFWFKNLDKLIEKVNARQANGSLVNLLYSTPSCYLDAVKSSSIEWSEKSDDFFPYASMPHAYWTGYFTSRPTSKRMILEGSQLLQIGRQMVTSMILKDETKGLDTILKATFDLDRITGVLQHHDAITGTERQHVANDYHETLSSAVTSLLTSYPVVGYEHCPLLNISQCEVTEGQDFIAVLVYNPMARTQTRYVEIPVAKDEYTVTLHTDGSKVPCQTVPVPSPVESIPDRETTDTFRLIIKAENLPPLGSKVFQIQYSPNPECKSTVVASNAKLNHSRWLESEDEFTKIFHKDQFNITFKQEIKYYIGAVGNNLESDNHASGAYLFRPVEQEPQSIDDQPLSTIYDGILFQETQLIYNNYVSQISRVYHEDPGFDVEIEWLIGPIDIDDHNGKEFVNVISTESINSDDAFYTDANGRQVLKRVRDFRPTFEIEQTEPVSQNYYPINSRIFIRDESSQMTLMNDRSQGGTSMRSGEIEVMMHRRLLHDDDFGVMEPLNETGVDGRGLVAIGKHYLLFDQDRDEANLRHRSWGVQLFSSPLLLFDVQVPTASDVQFMERWQLMLDYELPFNLNLISFQPWWIREDKPETGKHFLMRIEHIFQKNEHSTWSLPATLNVKEFLASQGEVISVRETNLGANAFKDTLTFAKKSTSVLDWMMEKLSWAKNAKSKQDNEFDIVFEPMEIKTLLVEFA